ncbi:hypothetical protein [Microvirga sp. VF16]|uniref:hypothetical protein n=1 Tax=Microvirga sp. VF16 TaxID=2807101 RepID=UPI00193CA650|nr:hypothetical protein [Microvirga sp. VF16]QRM28884.1 hypothetical protein JO965_22195 [Microvirga sp. VF16]
MAHLKQNKDAEFRRRDGTDSPSIDAMMREVLHMLGNIDFEYEVELERAERSSSDPRLKDHVKRRIRAAHHERREPYVELLAKLRQRQYRLSHQA